MTESPAVAEAAGLEYVNDAVPGITRERGADGWVYRRPDGTAFIEPEDRAWIDAIGIPPAWRGVWISPTPRGHILATGRDSRGRKQYRYHPRWREVRDATKYHRMVEFGEALPGVRRRIDADLELRGLPRDKVLGAVVRLMDETLVRIGNEQYARENQSFGLTTLRHEHVTIEDPATVRFEFRAKSGKEQRVRLSDARLASVVHACHELPGQELFSYVDDDGRIVDVGSAEVNAYLRAITEAVFTAKGLPNVGWIRDRRGGARRARPTAVRDRRQAQDHRRARRGCGPAQQHPRGVPQELRESPRARVIRRRLARRRLRACPGARPAATRGVRCAPDDGRNTAMIGLPRRDCRVRRRSR